LLTAWPQLRDWLDNDRTGLVIGQQVAEAAAAWRREQRDPAGLYRGTRLAAAQEWSAAHRHELSPPTLEFLGSSIRYARRRTRRLYQLIAALTGLVLVAGLLAGYAFQQRTEATNQRNEAISRLVALRANKLRAADVSLAMQLSLAAYRISPTVEA